MAFAVAEHFHGPMRIRVGTEVFETAGSMIIEVEQDAHGRTVSWHGSADGVRADVGSSIVVELADRRGHAVVTRVAGDGIEFFGSAEFAQIDR